jgi:hypothetical protein
MSSIVLVVVLVLVLVLVVVVVLDQWSLSVQNRRSGRNLVTMGLSQRRLLRSRGTRAERTTTTTRTSTRTSTIKGGGSVSLHHLREYHFLQVDESRPGANAGPIEIHRGFEDQMAAFHHQDTVGERHRFFDVVGD